MGIRIALGARPGEVRWLVVRRGAVLALTGVGIGLAGAFLSAGALRSLLFGVGPFDPLTFALVSASLATAALAACWIPAARAGRTDPMQALRNQ
jgi:putative ABC transport system permease protein